MPLISCKMVYYGAVPGTVNLNQERFNALLRMAWYATGEYWAIHFRPKHFTEAGGREYGYRKRTPKYQKSKQRQYGHQDPLVYSGVSKLLSNFYNVKATKNRVRVTMPQVRTLNRRPHMVAEMSTISAYELAKLVDVHTDYMAMLLSKITTRTEKRIAA